MTLAVSTSSPWVRVAFWDDGLVWSGERLAERAASGGVISLLQESGVALDKVERFVADIGPGSFSGVKVGVTMVKTWGFTFGKPVMGLSSFDLIRASEAVAIPSKRGEVYFRAPGETPKVVNLEDLEPGIAGYSGLAVDIEYPSFDLLGDLMETGEEIDAFHLVPLYIAPPSISTPKRTHIMGETFGA